MSNLGEQALKASRALVRSTTQEKNAALLAMASAIEDSAEQ